MEPHSQPPSLFSPRIAWGAALLCACFLPTLAYAQTGGVTTAPAPATGTVAAWSLLVIFVLTLLNGMFSMAESALLALRPSRVEQMVEEGRKGAVAVQRLSQNASRLIATTQVGITLVAFASAAAAATALAAPIAPLLTGIGLSGAFAHYATVIVVTLGIALLTIVLGEIAPKAIASQAPDVWSLRLAPFINLCALLFAPLTSVAIALSDLLVRPFGAKARFETPLITREEFEKIIDQGEKHGELDDDEAKIITNVFDLSETPVRSVMTPRIDMTMLDVDATLAKILETIIASGHSRIPVYENSVDNVIGIIHAKDLLPVLQTEARRDFDLRLSMRPPHFIPETKRVSDLLEEFRRSNQQLAIVQDEYAGTEGLVTIEDLLEEIVGDIRDEYDVDEPEVEVLSPTESLIDGRMSIDDVNDRLGVDLPHKDYDTIGGLVFGLLGHEPLPGERVRLDNMEFQVESVEGRRIRTLRAFRLPDPTTDEPADTPDATLETA